MRKKIGEFIKEVADNNKLSQGDLGRKINRSKQNVGNIYTRETIDTDLLLTICKVLDFDFFQFFYDTDETLKKFRHQELKQYNDNIERLSAVIIAHEKTIKLQEELLETQKELIAELKTKKF